MGQNRKNGIGVLLKKETDIDTLDSEELDSKALKLPLLSNSYRNVVDTTKAVAREVDVSRAANKGVAKDEYFPDLAKDEPLEPIPPQDIVRIEKPNGKTGSAGKVWEDKKANAHDDFSVYPRKDNSFKGEKGDDIAKANSKLVKECESTINAVFPVADEEKIKRERDKVTVAGKGIFRKTVAALLTLQEIRKDSSTYNHSSLPPLKLPDSNLIQSLQLYSPIPIL